ncbi:MAG: hypothetical protein ACTS4X_01030 [Candidatus Hodgkinia cicadicola]
MMKIDFVSRRNLIATLSLTESINLSYESDDSKLLKLEQIMFLAPLPPMVSTFA